MSDTPKAPRQKVINLYDLMDRELDRQHELLRTLIVTEAQRDVNSWDKLSNKVWDRVTHMADALTEAVRNHDKTVQERVAEMALTGDDTQS